MRICLPSKDGSVTVVDVEATTTVADLQQHLRRSLSSADERSPSPAATRRRSPAVSPSWAPSPAQQPQQQLGLPPRQASPRAKPILVDGRAEPILVG